MGQVALPHSIWVSCVAVTGSTQRASKYFFHFFFPLFLAPSYRFTRSARFSCLLTLNESTGSIHQAPTSPPRPRWEYVRLYSHRHKYIHTHTHTLTLMQNAFTSNDLLFVYDFSIFTVSEFENNHQSFLSFFLSRFSTSSSSSSWIPN